MLSVINKKICVNIYFWLCVFTLLYFYPENFCVNLSVLWMSNKLKFDQCLTLPTRYLVKSETLSPRIKHVSQLMPVKNVLSKFSLLYIDIRGGTGSPLFYLQAVFWLTRAVLTRLETCSPRFVRPRPTSVMSGSTLHTSTWSRSNTSLQYKW